MDAFGIPLLIVAMSMIFVIDAFSISYFKMALLNMRMRKPGFFLGSAGICIMSIVLSWVMAGAFLRSPVTAETNIDAQIVGMKMDGVVTLETDMVEVVIEEELEAMIEQEIEPEQREPELVQVSNRASAMPPTVQMPLTLTQTKTPIFSVWRGYHGDFDYNFVEVENGIPYVYMPNDRGDFQGDLNNIISDREGENIIIMANAGVFSSNTEPMGMTIQNHKIISQHDGADGWYWTLVVSEDGDVGYVNGVVNGTTVDYIDAKTGEMVFGKNIISAVYAFVPFMLDSKVKEEFRGGYQGTYRARQIFCVKQDSYVIITNTGEGIDGGGWDFDDMVQVANYRGCLSAFNLDGGGSTATAYRTALNKNFSILASTERHDPTFIVFTADNLAPRGR